MVFISFSRFVMIRQYHFYLPLFFQHIGIDRILDDLLRRDGKKERTRNAVTICFIDGSNQELQIAD